ncbi:MAG: hypothetical protein PUG67_06780 [Peptoniphilaceae bacterium]|nr:hypothetical protein [Peptoniphilaceae bacterium]MDY6019144.1 hypothetical protein [Anaerococcus sp.]
MGRKKKKIIICILSLVLVINFANILNDIEDYTIDLCKISEIEYI